MTNLFTQQSAYIRVKPLQNYQQTNAEKFISCMTFLVVCVVAHKLKCTPDNLSVKSAQINQVLI